jgi:hypothetical protein
MDRFVMQPHQLFVLKRRHRVRPAAVIAELNLEDARSNSLNHRANLATDQAVLRQVLQQCNNGKHLNVGHGELFSYST